MSWLKSKLRQVAVKAQDAFVQSMDIMAPTLYDSDVKEFHQRWLTVCHFVYSTRQRNIASQVEQKRLLQESNTPESLQKMVMILCTEEKKADLLEANTSITEVDHHDASRPCMEYLLEKQIIPTICNIGKDNEPNGVMALAMQFVTAVLEKLSYPMLPTREIHVSILQLVTIAEQMEDAEPVIRRCLVHLLHSLWLKLRSDPVQVEFFFTHCNKLQASPVAISTEPISPAIQTTGMPQLTIFTALLPYMYADGKLGERCREAIVIACGIPEKSLSQFIIKTTTFCSCAVDGVIAAYTILPKTLPEVRAVDDVADTDQEILQAALGIFKSRLRFCCAIATAGTQKVLYSGGNSISISELLAQDFLDRCLVKKLSHAILDACEANGTTGTLYARIILEEMISCCRDLRSNLLLETYTQYLLCEGCNIESDKKETKISGENQSVGKVCNVLIGRIDSLSPSLSIATMDLVTVLLELNDPGIDESLLGIIASKHAANTSDTQAHCQNAASVIERDWKHEALWFASRFPGSSIASHAHLWKMQGFATSINSLDIPNVAYEDNSEGATTQVISLLTYIVDAEYLASRQISSVFEDSDATEDSKSEDLVKDCGELSLSDANADDAYKSCTAEEESLSETATLHTEKISSLGGLSSGSAPLMLQVFFSRLERLLENTYEENLALSGLISVLAQKSHCYVLVFDSTDSLGAQQSIRSILEDLYHRAESRLSRMKHGASQLTEIRNYLLAGCVDGLQHLSQELRFLCAFVVLEEILKELCSFLFAKETVLSLPIKPEGYYTETRRSWPGTDDQIDDSLQSLKTNIQRTDNSATMNSFDQEDEMKAFIDEAAASINLMIDSTASKR